MPFRFRRRKFLVHAAAISSGCLGVSGGEATLHRPPVDIKGVGKPEADKIERLTTDFMQKHSVPGLSLAMSHQGKLKLLVCMGYADQVKREPVRSTHRFRVASVSKSLTSILVMSLRQSGFLDIDEPVLGSGVLGYRDEITKLGTANQRWLEKITTRHLLEHAAGGWGNESDDPMFLPAALGLDHDSLIRWTLSHRQLDHQPGTRYDYSNFGYCLIGRIIEKSLRMTYEDAFRAYVLRPLRMQDLPIRVGGNSLAERQAREVIYYGQEEDPYGQVMDVKRMDAHGGWVASPADLVRVLTRVDGFAAPSDLLNKESVRMMTAPSPANSAYAKGWSVNGSNNWWHTGSFNGGSAILARIHDNHCWAMAMNTRSNDRSYAADLDELPWKVKACAGVWGSHDFFDIC